MATLEAVINLAHGGQRKSACKTTPSVYLDKAVVVIFPHILLTAIKFKTMVFPLGIFLIHINHYTGDVLNVGVLSDTRFRLFSTNNIIVRKPILA